MTLLYVYEVTPKGAKNEIHITQRVDVENPTEVIAFFNRINPLVETRRKITLGCSVSTLCSSAEAHWNFAQARQGQSVVLNLL